MHMISTVAARAIEPITAACNAVTCSAACNVAMPRFLAKSAWSCINISCVCPYVNTVVSCLVCIPGGVKSSQSMPSLLQVAVGKYLGHGASQSRFNTSLFTTRTVLAGDFANKLLPVTGNLLENLYDNLHVCCKKSCYAAIALTAYTAACVLNETNVLKAKYALQVFSPAAKQATMPHRYTC